MKQTEAVQVIPTAWDQHQSVTTEGGAESAQTHPPLASVEKTLSYNNLHWRRPLGIICSNPLAQKTHRRIKKVPTGPGQSCWFLLPCCWALDCYWRGMSTFSSTNSMVSNMAAIKERDSWHGQENPQVLSKHTNFWIIYKKKNTKKEK